MDTHHVNRSVNEHLMESHPICRACSEEHKPSTQCFEDGTKSTIHPKQAAVWCSLHLEQVEDLLAEVQFKVGVVGTGHVIDEHQAVPLSLKTAAKTR